MSEAVLMTIISAGSAILSSIITHIITKRRYNSDVESVNLDNLLKQFEFYKNMVNDYDKQLKSYIQTAEETRNEMLRLRSILTSLVSQLCKDDKCTKRIQFEYDEMKSIITQQKD